MVESQQKKQAELLDDEELLHLAMTAINAGQHPQAMALLKQAHNQNPDNASAIYLLAAEYAQIGLFDRAMEGMEAALAKTPDLHMAKLQLGILYTARDRGSDARPLFEELCSLPKEDPLHWFATGLAALLDERIDTCQNALKKGIELNKSNPSLNMDMQRILIQLEQPSSPPEIESTDKTKVQSKSQSITNSLYLSRYDKNNSKND